MAVLFIIQYFNTNYFCWYYFVMPHAIAFMSISATLLFLIYHLHCNFPLYLIQYSPSINPFDCCISYFFFVCFLFFNFILLLQSDSDLHQTLIHFIYLFMFNLQNWVLVIYKFIRINLFHFVSKYHAKAAGNLIYFSVFVMFTICFIFSYCFKITKVKYLAILI